MDAIDDVTPSAYEEANGSGSGTYVDIGGFSPIKFSNTYKLYQKGWSGIVVEPNPVKTKNWKIIRPKDFVINAALVPESYIKKEIELFKNDENDPTESPIRKDSKSKSYVSKIRTHT